jgi:hypothetical protein
MVQNDTKLPEGWCNTEKHGDVFISPGGIGWVVQRIGNKLESVAVKISKDEIIGKTAIEKRTDAIRRQTRRTKSKVSRTKAPNLTPSAAEVVNSKVLEVVN